MKRGIWPVLVLAAAIAFWWMQPVTLPPIPETSQPTSAVESPLVVRDVAVRDVGGQVAWRGDVDLRPVLARIERGQGDTHRNDGGIFQNREGRLPQRPRGHYREYVVRTPGISHAGPQRLVIGRDGEVYYTADHYRNFRRLQ